MAPKVPTDPAMTPEVRSFLESLQTQADGAAGTTQTDYISGIIKNPVAQDYRILEKIPYSATLSSFTTKTSSGTLTATLKINSTGVTGGGASVTSSQATATLTALNTMASGDTLVITGSSISSPVDFSFTVAYTKTLDA